MKRLIAFIACVLIAGPALCEDIPGAYAGMMPRGGMPPTQTTTPPSTPPPAPGLFRGGEPAECLQAYGDIDMALSIVFEVTPADLSRTPVSPVTFSPPMGRNLLTQSDMQKQKKLDELKAQLAGAYQDLGKFSRDKVTREVALQAGQSAIKLAETGIAVLKKHGTPEDLAKAAIAELEVAKLKRKIPLAEAEIKKYADAIAAVNKEISALEADITALLKSK